MIDKICSFWNNNTFLILNLISEKQSMVVSLSILDYDVSKSSARYRGLVNDDQVVVAHLQSVDTKESPLSQLSLSAPEFPRLTWSSPPPPSQSSSSRRSRMRLSSGRESFPILSDG